MRVVLVIDDSQPALAYAAAVLGKSGYEVDTAINIAEVVACLSQRQPDAVVVDVDMPQLHGHDLVGYLRTVYKIQAPIVLYSGMDETELAALARRSHADGFVRKTSDPAALPVAVEAALARTA